MGYVEVAVNFPGLAGRTFTYSLPPGASLEPGQAVWVPFGPRTLQGVVVGLSDFTPLEAVREVAGSLHPEPLLSPPQLALAGWLSGYYFSPLFDALALMLPPGFARPLRAVLEPAAAGEGQSVEEGQVLALVRRRGRVGVEAVEKLLGNKSQARQVLARLQRRGLLRRSREVARPRVGPKLVSVARLKIAGEEAAARAAEREHKAPRQAALLRRLRESGELPLDEIRKRLKPATAVVKALERQGLVAVETSVVRRDPLARIEVSPQPPPALTPAQEKALAAIREALDQASPGPPAVFLLHGVTGSGKTEIYLQALAYALRRGQRGVVLVPEISLTSQTIDRFAARFPGRVAVLHSRLSLRENYDTWWGIKQGGYDVVIGPRSALFAPQPGLGLIVLDEEHEGSYKGMETPRYHAREAAIELAALTGAVVILGSATPDVESFYRAQRGQFHLLELPRRISPAALPPVEVVDLSQELKAGYGLPFSRRLAQGLEETLAAGEKAILFLNRRGAATLVRCRRCGTIQECRRCAVALVYHRSSREMRCHQCGYRRDAPTRCPRCGHAGLSFLGMGTQRVEAELEQLFPRARLLRYDRDVARGGEETLKRFAAGEADVLIGTQMVAKGLDFPQVTLVGVVSADTSLPFPDLRSGERTFQLLSQVSGRTGRGALPGRVIVQTYRPEHYAIQAAAAHDYRRFYEQEIAYRQAHRYPPFSRLVRLVYTHPSLYRCREEAQRLKQRLGQEMAAAGMGDIQVMGPSPCFLSRLRGRFRWQLLLQGEDPTPLLNHLPLPSGWTVDVDPVQLL